MATFERVRVTSEIRCGYCNEVIRARACMRDAETENYYHAYPKNCAAIHQVRQSYEGKSPLLAVVALEYHYP